MIHAICDFCGKDCDRSAMLVSITPFKNFARYHTDSDPYGSKEKSVNFTICEDCRKKHDLPNPYRFYEGITAQKLKYEKTVDNYTEENFKEDAKRKLQHKVVLQEEI